MRRLVRTTTGMLVCAALSFGAGSAAALTLEFDCVSNNLGSDCAIGEGQLLAELSAGPGANQVTVKFTNAGPGDSVISEVYFDDDGGLLSLASIVDGSEVDFESGAKPPILPAGNQASPSFEVTAGLSAGAAPPGPSNGVNPGEMLELIFDLLGGNTLADVEAAIADGSLRIGLHVQSFQSGGSESFVNDVPEPSVALMLFAALLGLGRSRQLMA